jgi:hypothetical protein
MEMSALLLLFGMAAALKQDPVLPIHETGFTVSRIPLAGNPLPMSELKVAEHVVPLIRGNAKSLSSTYVQAMRGRRLDSAGGTGFGVYLLIRIFRPGLH